LDVLDVAVCQLIIIKAFDDDDDDETKITIDKELVDAAA